MSKKTCLVRHDEDTTKTSEQSTSNSQRYVPSTYMKRCYVHPRSTYNSEKPPSLCLQPPWPEHVLLPQVVFPLYCCGLARPTVNIALFNRLARSPSFTSLEVGVAAGEGSSATSELSSSAWVWPRHGLVALHARVEASAQLERPCFPPSCRTG